MAEQTTQPSTELDRAAEEAGFYHEAALNAAWTGVRLALGALSFLYGAFAFAYFYLRSLNSPGRWHGSGYHAPADGYGRDDPGPGRGQRGDPVRGPACGSRRGEETSGRPPPWSRCCLGLAAVVLQIMELLNLPFQPGSSGFASVFTGTYPVLLVSWLAVMIWLEILIMRARPIPEISFVEQPPTYAEAFAVQRFQSALSALHAHLELHGHRHDLLLPPVLRALRGKERSVRVGLRPRQPPAAHDRHEPGCLALVGQRGGRGRVPAGHGRAPGRAGAAARRRTPGWRAACRRGWRSRRSRSTPACWPCVIALVSPLGLLGGHLHLGPRAAGPPARRRGARR